MGFGASLALGLVQGFTKNIQEEQARRDSDFKKIDDLNTLMLDAAMKGNLHPRNSTLISAAIRDARGEMDEKERISIFGKRTDPISLDITELAPFLHYNDPNAKEDDDGITKTFGKGIDFTSPYWKTMNASTARDWLAEVASKHTDYRTKYAENPGLYQQVLQAAKGAESTIIASAIESAGGDKTKIQIPDFTFLDDFYNYGSAMNLENVNAQAVNAEVNNTTLSQQFNTNVVTSFKFSPEMEGEMSRLAGIATDSPEELTAMANIAKGLGTTVPELGAEWKKYTARFKMTDDMAFQLLTSSIQLGAKNPYIYTFDPDKKYKTYSDAEKTEAYKSILDVAPNNNFNSLVYTLAPYMKYDKESGMTIPGYNTLGSPTQKQDYVIKRLGGLFESFGKLDNAVTANETVVLQLEEYVATLNMTDAPVAYQNTKLFLNSIFGFTDDRSFFGALTRDLFTGNEDENRELREGEYYLDENNSYESYRDEKIRAAEDMGLSAELEAFRVGLAFQMARAADPSGRLSNQDIELQMVRLGGSFRTVGDAVRATSVVVNQFKEELAKYKVFRDYGTGTGDMKNADAGVIDAAIVLKDMERIAKRVGIVTEQAQATAATSFDKKSVSPSGVYQTEDGQPVYVALTPQGGVAKDVNGNNIYVDSDGQVVKNTQRIQVESSPPPESTADGTPPPPVSEDNQTVVPEAKADGTPTPPVEDPTPTGSIPYSEVVGDDAKYTATKTGNNYILTETLTGKKLPGQYRYEDDKTKQTYGNFVPVEVGA